MIKPIFTFILCLLAVWASAQKPPILPNLPPNGYVIDDAHLLSDATKAKINDISNRDKLDSKSPVVVVTIDSLASMNAGEWPIEDYATHLFDVWEIGTSTINRGVLILVSKQDRKARITTGAGWNHSLDDPTKGIMDGTIVPKFKTGDYDGGILAGVEQLDSLIRDRSGASPGQAPPIATGQSDSVAPNIDDSGLSGGADLAILGIICPIVFVFVIIVTIASVVSRRRRYYGGGGYVTGGFWGGGYSSTNVFIDNSSSGSSFSGSSSSSGSDSGFSGGSDFSGGGSSDGGGCSGSW